MGDPPPQTTKPHHKPFITFSQLLHNQTRPNWPRWLCVGHPRWRLQCVAGHCYCQLMAHVALRAPPEVAFTMRSWPLLLPSFSLSFFLAQTALQCVAGHCYCHRSVSLSFLFFFPFFSLRLLLLNHFEESPVCENLFPPIFWHLFFYEKKKISARFFSVRPAFGRGAWTNP